MRAGLSPERIVEAALDLADTTGFAHVTVSSVARHVGVRSASLYSHIEDLHDLRTRMALRALEELAQRASESLAGRSGSDALAALGNVYRDYAHEHPGRFAAARFPLDSDTAMVSAGPRHAALTRAVLRGYAVPESEQPHAVRLLGSTFLGYVTLELSTGFSHSAPDSQASWRRILEVLDHTLRHWPGS
ncbi:TetR/AcrR family transcriptional regulator [Kocuria sp. SM24M-10]|uniref:TetR/AcrR family transcriptional regulator n=1 Tax=Kocuria sp. SM24M-10 TaxID=1660349 RepID=UPI00064B7885|nr:TetR-like C-terminal domain-containing protein [Kocuria sp. SM24M-10]KLU11379.1 TetR family transcriptional regulator [Kocuria sp. SM24M-10]